MIRNYIEFLVIGSLNLIKVTHKIDDISPDEINDKLDSIEDIGLEDGNHKYKISESKSSKYMLIRKKENKTYAICWSFWWF